MKQDRVEVALDRLSTLRGQPASSEVERELRTALRDRVNLVVAKAAKVAGELRVTALVGDLDAAFTRLMANPQKLDKGCAATIEIATALHEMDYLEPELYLRGVRHVQMEPSFGPPVDAAARLRAQCALGLVRTRHPDALNEIVALLVDPEPLARLGAVRALACANEETAALLLRLKLLTGDRDVEIIAECFARLLALAPERSLSFVGRYIDAEAPAVSEAAILAIGGSRTPEAIALLREEWARTVAGPVRNTLLLALATARSDEATDFLLEQLKIAGVPLAEQVLAALATYSNTPRVQEAADRIITERDDSALRRAFDREFR